MSLRNRVERIAETVPELTEPERIEITRHLIGPPDGPETIAVSKTVVVDGHVESESPWTHPETGEPVDLE